MNKKLTRFDIMMVLGFLFALTVAVGAFFFGLQTGKQQTDAKYRTFMEQLADEQKQGTVSYHQQHLVSFYHTVLVPFREFQLTWLKHSETIQSGSGSSHSGDLLRELSRLAKAKAAEIEPMTIPEVSPLLRQAQANYLRSLTLFAEAASRLQGGPDGALLAESMRQDPFVVEAAGYALKAQQQYYESIWKWNEANEPGIAGADLIGRDNMSYGEWRSLNLNAKNAFIAHMLMIEGEFASYYPQDVSARIDDLDAAGQVGKLQFKDLASTVRTLISTGAVRSGDFIHSKAMHYRNENLPLLPFFTE